MPGAASSAGRNWHQHISSAGTTLTAFAAVAALLFTAVSVRQASGELENRRKELQIAQEGQVTERFTAAVELLGENKTDMRLGGIYALQRIMQDSHRDQPAIANVLNAYVRTKRPANGKSIREDVQSALTVLVTRDVAHDKTFVADLQDTYLVGADLVDANLRGVWLDGADLRNAGLDDADLRASAIQRADLRNASLGTARMHQASLYGSDLRKAILWRTDLRNASLYRTDLRRAYMEEADLRNANLGEADLRNADLLGADLRDANFDKALLKGADLGGADLRGADLRGADLRGADLRGVKNATREQLERAITDITTKMPDDS